MLRKVLNDFIDLNFKGINFIVNTKSGVNELLEIES